jgi:hypothetical protein
MTQYPTHTEGKDLHEPTRLDAQSAELLDRAEALERLKRLGRLLVPAETPPVLSCPVLPNRNH